MKGRQKPLVEQWKINNNGKSISIKFMTYIIKSNALDYFTPLKSYIFKYLYTKR